MKRFSLFSLLALGVFAAIILLNACQKDNGLETVNGIKDDVTASNRAQVCYGVNVYDGVNPCSIIQLDNATGNVTNVAAQATYVDNNNITYNLDNLKGICLTGWGQYFMTTGNPINPTVNPTLIYNNALFKVNPINGQASYASTCPFGTVSDLEQDPNTLVFYGLLNNTNSIVEIVDNNNNYGTYNGPFAITGIAAGYTLKGLSLVNTNGAFSMVGCATRAGAGITAKLYRIPLNGGPAAFITDLDPVAELAGGHCGIGFDIDINQLLINRGPFSQLIPGLNRMPWNPPFGPVTMTGAWGGLGWDYEDLTSDVQ